MVVDGLRDLGGAVLVSVVDTHQVRGECTFYFGSVFKARNNFARPRAVRLSR